MIPAFPRNRPWLIIHGSIIRERCIGWCCLCFPGLLVKVRRNRRCIVRYRDENWQVQELACEGYLSELIQHEYDHLNGILATMRAVDGKAFVMKA